MGHMRRPPCHLFPYKEDIMAEGNCVHCVSVTEYHPINYTDNFFEVSCEVSINTSLRHDCQDVTDHRVKRAQRDLLRILGSTGLVSSTTWKQKRKNNFGPRRRYWFPVRRLWILNTADLDTFHSLPIFPTYFTDTLHCFIQTAKEFMKRKYKYQWKKSSIFLQGCW
jgi:hypothetical protein